MANVVLNINMDAKCAECRRGGATKSGLCLGCCAKAMDPKRKMRSAEGQSVQRRIAEQWVVSQFEKG